MNLNGTVGILTGASRGLGVVLAEHLAGKGVDLVLAARSGDELERTAERVRARGRRALGVPTDLADRGSLQDLVRRAQELGPVDLLVNNAGIEQLGDFWRLELDAIESMLTNNLVAEELLTRLVLPGMVDRRRG